MERINKIKVKILPYIGIFCFLNLWEILPRLGVVDAQFLPPFSTVCLAIQTLWQDGILYTNTIISLWRVLIGLLLAIFIAVPLGFFLEVFFPEISKRLDGLFNLLSHVNPFSLAPLFILLFGIGEKEKLAIISLSAVWPILFHTITGIRSVNPILIKTGRSMNISTGVLIKDILFPGALPIIITGIRLGVQMSMFMLIAAEMMGAGAGLGWLVHNSAMVYQIPRLYAGGVFIILLGMSLNKIILWFQTYSWFWQERTGVAEQTHIKRRHKQVSSVAVFCFMFIFSGVLFFGGNEVHKINTQVRTLPMNHDMHQHSAGMEKGAETTEPQKAYVPNFKADEDKHK